MAEIDRFTAKAPRRGSIAVPSDDGTSDMLASIAQTSSQFAARLGNWADQAAVREGKEAGAAAAMSVTMPGVDFAFSGTSPATTSVKPVNSAQGGELESYIRAAAVKRGIDPDIAVRVARSEGLAPGVWQSNVVKNGRRERSYGPFQLYIDGGLGNEFQKRYGKSAADPATVYQQIDFALDKATQLGWTPWYGAARVGIGAREGLPGARTTATADPTVTSDIGKSEVDSQPTGISVTLTGAAGVVPQMRAGTLRGDAYNNAALDIHINRLDTAMREQMDGLALAHDGDPAGLSASLDALRAGYVKDLPPAAAALIDQSFARQKFSLQRQAVDKFNKNLESANIAAFEENLASRTTSVYRMAANAGTDAEADAAIAGELGALTAQIDASPLNPLQKSRAKSAAVEGVMSARVLGGFEAQKDPAARAAYAQKFQEDWKSGEGLAAKLDVKAYDSINGELLRRTQADAVAANKRDTALNSAIKDQIGTLKKGWPLTDHNRELLKSEVAKTGDAQLAANLHFMDGLADWQKAHVASKPEIIDAQINALRAKIQKEGATEAALTTLDVMEGLRDEMRKGLSQDPLTWANRAGVATVDPLDFSAGPNLAASLTERVADAQAVAQHYGIQPKYFTAAETDGLKKMLKQTPLALPSIVSSLSAGLGSATPQALGEISKDAPLLAHVAGLTDATGSQRVAVEVAEVLDRRNQPGYKSVLPPASKLQSAASMQVGAALLALPGTQAGAMETAAALFEARALSRGIDMEQFDTPGSPAREMYLDAVDEVLGATTRDGVKFGGLAGVNGAMTVAPPDIEADRLEDMVASISSDDLLFQDAIGSVNGVPIRPDQLHGAKLVMTGQGHYRLALGDVAGGDPRYVPAADGGYFELDLGMLRRSQETRGLSGQRWSGQQKTWLSRLPR